MKFWNKITDKKIIEFTPVEASALDFPPVPTKFMLPQWFKDMPVKIFEGEIDAIFLQNNPNFGSNLTIKKCIPVQDYMTSGYMIKSYGDVMLSNFKNNEYDDVAWQTKFQKMSGHGHGQCPISIQNQKKHYFKFHSGFSIKTPRGYSCLFYQHEYLMEDRFTLFPAIVDTDTYDAPINFSGFLNSSCENTIVKAGTPLIVVFPFKRENWSMKINNNVVAVEETYSWRKIHQHFEHAYLNYFHAKKKYD